LNFIHKKEKKQVKPTFYRLVWLLEPLLPELWALLPLALPQEPLQPLALLSLVQPAAWAG
jgi:hypothetical protein